MNTNMNFYSRNKQLKADINSAIKSYRGRQVEINMAHIGYNLSNTIKVDISSKKQKYEEDYMSNLKASFHNGEVMNSIEIEKVFGRDFLLGLITLTISDLKEIERTEEQNKLISDIKETMGCQ